MANGSLTTMTSGEGKVRESLIRADVVDCIVAIPAQLFYTTGIPVCLWFLDRDKAATGTRDRRGETLFIDARQLGQKISRTQIEMTKSEIERTRRFTTRGGERRRALSAVGAALADGLPAPSREPSATISPLLGRSSPNSGACSRPAGTVIPPTN